MRKGTPCTEYRLNIHIGAAGSLRQERKLKHAFLCGIGPSTEAMRVGAKALCAAFRAEELPTATHGDCRPALKKLLREALARATATLVAAAPAAPPASTLAPTGSARVAAPILTAPPTLAPAAPPASTLAPAAPPASTLAPAASTVSTLAPAASPVSNPAPTGSACVSAPILAAPPISAPAASPVSTLAPAAPPVSTPVPTGSACVAAPIVAAPPILAPAAPPVSIPAPTGSARIATPILAAPSTTLAPPSDIVAAAGAGYAGADPTDALGEDVSDDGGCDIEEPGHESFVALAGAAEPATAVVAAAAAATDSATAFEVVRAESTAASAAPTDGVVPLGGAVTRRAAPLPQRRRASRRIVGKADRGGRAHTGASPGNLLLCCDDVIIRVLSNLDALGVFLVAETCRRLAAVVAVVARNRPFWELMLFKRCALAEPVAEPRLLCHALQVGMEAGTPPSEEQDAVGVDAVRAWWRCAVLRVQGPKVLVLYDSYELPEWRWASDVRVAPVRVRVTEVDVLYTGVLEVSYSTKAQRPPSWWEAVVEGVLGVRTVSVSWKGDPMFEGEVARFTLLRKSRPFSPLLRVALPSVAGGREAVAQGVWTRYITATRGSQ